MANWKIVKLLEKHDISYFEEDGSIYAQKNNSFNGKFENLTGFTLQEILSWLGY